MPGKFVIRKDEQGEFHFTLRAASGQTLALSEGYPSKAACVNGAESVRKHAADAELVDETSQPS